MKEKKPVRVWWVSIRTSEYSGVGALTISVQRCQQCASGSIPDAN